MPSGWINKKGFTRNGQYIAGRIDIYARDNYTCCYCGKHCDQGAFRSGMGSFLDRATLDHIVSQYELAKSAESDAEFRRMRRDPKNLVVVCNGCNSSKRHMELYPWAMSKGLDYGKILVEIGIRINKPIVGVKA